MKNYFIVATICVVFLVGIMFYWVQVRPSIIRKKCMENFTSELSVAKKRMIDWNNTAKVYFDEVVLKKCLLQQGVTE